MEGSIYQTLANGITRIDTGHGKRPCSTAAYLIEEAGDAAFVDTGTSLSVPRFLELLDVRGIAREHVKYVMPTHVHLDHAGGAGTLMEALPEAQLVIHPRGARHMIDPGKLASATAAVYGEDVFRTQFGSLVPVPEERVIVAEDGQVVLLGERELVLFDTPGHANHHYCVHDARSEGFFTGDTFGVSMREFDSGARPCVFPTTSPVQFDPNAWHATLDRLLACSPRRMYVTHFGMVQGDIHELAGDLRRGVDQHARIARSAKDAPERHKVIKAALTESLLADLANLQCPVDAATSVEIMSTDLELNAQGLGIWLDRQTS